ncbi:MAG: HutD family protein [Actinomycetota bacterium]
MNSELEKDLGIVRFAELPAMPWRNGGGITREVVAAGSFGPDFDWRVSIADVNVPGPFSAFPGVDRTITLLQGDRMDLVIDGVEQVLGRFESLSFDGASRTSCSLPAGPTRDLNVMTRRDRVSAAVTMTDLSQTRPIAVAAGQVLVLLTGVATVGVAGGTQVELRPLDAVCPRGPVVTEVGGSGRAAVVRIESRC